MSTYNFDVAMNLNEFDIRTMLRDSTDLLGKLVRDLNSYSAKQGRVVLCKFYEYGYPEEWREIMFSLWDYWKVKNLEEFNLKMEELTSKDRTQMLEEIAFSEILGILKSRNYEN